MIFSGNDTYVAGGSDKIYNIWTAGVRKFDSNSFYNWEQDNVPLYDLEDRTYHLWEKQGWDGSSVEGASLTVSADASAVIVNTVTGETALQVNSNIFIDLSSAMAAIPEVIRYPIRIEVCNFGRLGKLELHNIKCVERGALEIVNRNFAKISLTDIGGVSGTAYSDTVFVDNVSSADLGTMLSPAIGGISAMALSAPLFSGTADVRALQANAPQIFIQHPSELKMATGDLKRTANMTVLYDVTRDPDSNGDTNRFGGTIYGSMEEDSTTPYDISAIIHPGALQTLIAKAGITAEPTPAQVQKATGFYFGNYCDSISIKNCVGPIYVRNFQVNGTPMSVTGTELTSYTKDTGIDIANSELVLENCAAWRCNEAGIKIVNSNVTLSKGCIGYRNYDFINRDSSAVTGAGVKGCGLYALGSNIALSSGPITYAASGGDFILSFNTNTKGAYFNNCQVHGGQPSSLTAWGGGVSGTPSFQTFINNDTGLLLENTNFQMNGRVEAWQNFYGIKCTNSILKSDQLRVEYNQKTGMTLNNSNYIYGINNQAQMVTPTRNKNLLTNGRENGTVTTAALYGQTIDYPGQVHFHWNEQHLRMNNSKFDYNKIRDFNTGEWPMGRIKFKMGMGQSGPASATIPSIRIDSNSLARFFQTCIFTEGIPAGDGAVAGVGDFNSGSTSEVSAAGTGSPSHGSCISITDNSTAVFNGTQDAVTYLDGPPEYDDQKYNSLVDVNDHSSVRFSGPTILMRGGVDVLARNNSKMEFCPHKEIDSDFIDVSGYALSAAGNQTKINLHSSRACLVAQGNSDIIMEDLGAYTATWRNSADGTADLGGSSIINVNNYSIQETSSFTASGSMQFYPNPQGVDAEAHVPYDPSGTLSKGNIADNKSLPLGDRDTPDVNYNNPTGSGAQSVMRLSMGGMCVRALQNSRVKVNNVHFPAGWPNTSAIYYNFGAENDLTGCEQLRIWNIDGTSELECGFTSVSSLFPADAGYHGPSAVYVSGGTAGMSDAWMAASGAPSSTPHTNTLSVLDSFGPSGDSDSATAGTTVSPQNFGPFRLYFSPLGPAKLLTYAPRASGTGDIDPEALAGNFASSYSVYQSLAQGYNPSACCSATHDASTVGSIYNAGPTAPWYVWGVLNPSALGGSSMPNGEDWYYTTNATPNTMPNAGDPRAPSFFYVKDMLPRDYYGRIRLDESAMATFANAKNGTLGTSGRIRLVTAYKAVDSPGLAGGEGVQPPSGEGRGFYSASNFGLGKRN